MHHLRLEEEVKAVAGVEPNAIATGFAGADLQPQSEQQEADSGTPATLVV